MNVSVIIPFYGNVQWLKEAIDSAIEQDYGVYEVLVIDDESPYDLTSLKDHYSTLSTPVRFVRIYHSGPGAARNVGIRLSQGDYFAFLDADDVWDSNKLSLQIPYMQQHGYLWSHTGFVYWNSLHNKFSTRHTDISKEHDDVSERCFCGFRIATPSVVISRQVFIEHPEIMFDESLTICEDSDLYRQIAQHYPIGLIAEPLVKVRLTGSNTRLQIFKRFIAGEENYRRTKGAQGVYASIPRRSMIRFIYTYYHYCYTFLHNFNSSTFRELLSKLLFIPIYLTERIYLRKLNQR